MTVTPSAVVLVNPSNQCYVNSVLHCILWLGKFSGDTADYSSCSLASAFVGLHLQQAGVILHVTYDGSPYCDHGIHLVVNRTPLNLLDTCFSMLAQLLHRSMAVQIAA